LFGVAGTLRIVITGANFAGVNVERLLPDGPIQGFAQGIQIQIARAVPVTFGHVVFSPIVVIVQHVSVELVGMLCFEKSVERFHGVLLGWEMFLSRVFQFSAPERRVPGP
jgi:hypothetical protein